MELVEYMAMVLKLENLVTLLLVVTLECMVRSYGGYGVYREGNFAATGAKTAIVSTSQGDRKLYSQESPEVWFEDFGEGQLMGGMAQIKLDPLFLETVTINDQNP